VTWRIWVILFALWISALGQTTMRSCPQCAEWNRPQPPFQIFGNTYYVGPHGLSSVLITSSSGHVLIDGALPESASLIAANMRSLGFRIVDVKLIVNSHAHIDHAGGIAELQRLSGARVLASAWSAKVLAHGGVGRGDPQYGSVSPIAPVKNVHVLQDGQSLRLGDILITPHLTPGHTPGGTSWTWKSCAGNICRDMVYADSLTPVASKGFQFTSSRAYPHALADFETSFAFLENVPCDILLTPHPELSGLWEHIAARERGVTPDPMVDTNACRRLAEHAREQLRQRIAEEQSAGRAH